MAYFRLEDIAELNNEPLEKLIPRMIAEEGTVFGAAVRLGVAPNTLHNWLKRNGYRIESRRQTIVTREASHETR